MANMKANGENEKNETKPTANETTTSNKDGGYAWVVLFAAMCEYCLVAMSLGCLAVLYPEIIDHFDCTKAAVGWIGSLNGFVGAFNGLILAPFLRSSQLSCRTLAICGGILGTIGYATSFAATKTVHLYITFGVIGGFGSGMLFYASTVILQQYFDRRRSTATAIATSGYSLAPLIFAPTTRLFVKLYGWRGSLLVIAGIYLNSVVAACLMRPLPPSTGGNQALNPAISVVERPVTLRGHIKTVLSAIDCSFLMDINFVVFVLGSVLALFGYITPFVFLLAHACADFDITRNAGTALVAILSFGMTTGRLTSGLLGDFRCAKVIRDRRLLQYATLMTLCGFCNITMIVLKTYVTLAVYGLIVGLLSGGYMVVQHPVLVDLLGVNRFARSFAIFTLFHGFAALACQPFAGWLVDVSGHYTLAFVACGILQAAGGFLLIGLACTRRYTSKVVKENDDLTLG